ncbi:MAG: type III-A CRISPR-associated protein Cas10/Csm1 [bacterium]|nr:type III-A CRISPR-associated protein Cas10/Csm1 [bacterium]
MSKNAKREALILGALLHDIGKFYQRAYPEKEKLSPTTLNLQQHICPFIKKYNFFTHNHVLWTNEFFEKHLKELNEAANFAIYHHKPEKYEQKIIRIADWLSSGERIEKETEEERKEVQEEPLVSIFSQIKLKENNIVDYYCKALPVSKNIEDLFPVKGKQDAINDKTNFRLLWDEFEHDFGKIDTNSVPFSKLFTRIFSLVEKYALFVPSSAYRDKPHISLFHHLKSTAAIATCIYDINHSEKEIDAITDAFQTDLSRINKDDFVLISGDISGIQDFIYSLTTSGALKGLRGRSFYIQLLSETIARYILDTFELFECNLLYCGGGNFSILAPKKEDFGKKIEEVEKKISKGIFSLHPNLALILACVELTYNDFSGENFQKTIVKLKKEINIKKRRKFTGVFDYKTIFKPFPEDIDKELKGCEICGAEIEEGVKCEQCKSFEELANNIRKADIIKVEKTSVESQQDWKKLFSLLGYNYDFVFTKSDTSFNYAINDADFLDKNCDGWRFEPFYSPEGTLEDIAKKSTGDKKWAALKMDVDNLGMIFSEGLKENLSISRFSMLSYMMNLFFTAGIDYLRRCKFQDCCVVYAGGDDLFIIGPWSKIPYFAMEINKYFKNYTCNRSDITISAGTFIAPSDGFPVYRAALEADNALTFAKKENKDHICFLETVASWNEFKEIEEIATQLSDLIKKDGISRSILNVFAAGYVEEELLKKKKIPYLRVWRIFYAIKRFMERHKNRNIQDKLEELRKKFISSDYSIQPKLNMAVRWAELLTRKEKTKE